MAAAFFIVGTVDAFQRVADSQVNDFQIILVDYPPDGIVDSPDYQILIYQQHTNRDRIKNGLQMLLLSVEYFPNLPALDGIPHSASQQVAINLSLDKVILHSFLYRRNSHFRIVKTT